MSTAHNNALWLRPYGEIDTSVPDCGVTVLPGRLAALTHPLNEGRTIQLPDREIYDPDVATVVSSGIEGFDPGDVVILAPDHGAYYPDISPDKRELRIVGVACPWWESVLAKLDANGLHPAPGWMLVRLGGGEVGKSGGLLLPTSQHPNLPTSVVLASHGDHHAEPHRGERVVIDGLRTYTVRNEGSDARTSGRPAERTRPDDRTTEPPNDKHLALVRAPIASKQWLLSLNKKPTPSASAKSYRPPSTRATA